VNTIDDGMLDESMTDERVWSGLDWSALRGRLTGEIVLAGDERMKLANKQFAAGRALPQAQALIRCKDRDDVRCVLEFVRERALPFSVRSGGHCFADFSSSSGVTIDLADIAFCRRADAGVRVGPGLYTGHLASALGNIGLAFPTGGCPWVGIGGLSLVGGFGFLGRGHGLATDRVAALEVVTADGEIVECDADNASDLFWALRGAGGGGFGIVTALSLRTLPFPDFSCCFGAWPIEEAVALIEIWQAHFAAADPRINLEVMLKGSDYPDEPCAVALFGLILGGRDEVAPQLAEVQRVLGPLAANLRVWEPPDRANAAGYLCGLIDHQGKTAWQPCMPYERCGYQFTRSDFFGETIATESIVDCVRHFSEQRRYPQVRELEFIPWGGAYAEHNHLACFAHRDARMMLRHTSMLGARADQALREASATWVDGSRTTLASQADSGVYSGYADRRLDGWERAYYRDAYPRLQSIKAKYDPANLFRHAQTVRLPGP
jgi:FAD/FMN-containing dehydrogenase